LNYNEDAFIRDDNYMERPETVDKEYPEVHSLLERYYHIPRLDWRPLGIETTS
jgi:hypothetical protein